MATLETKTAVRPIIPRMPTVKVGKYMGQPYTSVPKDYAEWQRANGNYKFYRTWLEQSRFALHTDFKCTTRSADGRWYSRDLKDGSHLFYVQPTISHGKSIRIYYIVDSEGNYLRDVTTFREIGAIDATQTDWVTLSPNGDKFAGKMLVSPYYTHFEWETYIKKAKIN